MTRHFWVLAHRYAGLYMAFFLAVAGLTGSVLAFYHEIDFWLNPGQHRVPVQARAMLDPLQLRERALALAPQARINFVRLRREPGEVYSATLELRTDPATGKPYALDYATIRLDPYTGELIEFGKDEGYWPLTRKNVLRFIFDLHYKLALGEVGVWLFGVAAAVWTVDCCVGFYLTLPARRKAPNPLPAGGEAKPRGFWSRWSIAWKVKWRGSAYRINFDLHRAGGLWTWAMLFVFAWSSVCFNLGRQVYQPVMHVLFAMPDAEVFPRPPLPTPRPAPALDWRAAHAIGQRLMAEQARRAGFEILTEEWLAYDAAKGVYAYTVGCDRDFVDQGGMTSVYFDGDSGAWAGQDLPSGRNIGVTITYWLVSLHMAHVWGLPYRIAVCCMGLVVAMLSVTGVYLWLQKRRAARMRRALKPPVGVRRAE